jgi:hypothetical protein
MLVGVSRIQVLGITSSAAELMLILCTLVPKELHGMFLWHSSPTRRFLFKMNFEFMDPGSCPKASNFLWKNCETGKRTRFVVEPHFFVVLGVPAKR